MVLMPIDNLANNSIYTSECDFEEGITNIIRPFITAVL